MSPLRSRRSQIKSKDPTKARTPVRPGPDDFKKKTPKTANAEDVTNRLYTPKEGGRSKSPIPEMTPEQIEDQKERRKIEQDKRAQETKERIERQKEKARIKEELESEQRTKEKEEREKKMEKIKAEKGKQEQERKEKVKEIKEEKKKKDAEQNELQLKKDEEDIEKKEK